MAAADRLTEKYEELVARNAELLVLLRRMEEVDEVDDRTNSEKRGN